MVRQSTPTTRHGSTLAKLSPLLLYGGIAAGMLALSSGWAAIIGYHLAICIVLTLGRGWSGGHALVRGWSTKLALPLIALCLASGPLIAILWPWIRLEGMTLSGALASVRLDGWGWLAFMAYYSLVNPWLEELFWRGWYPTVVRRGVAADLLFSGYHVIVVALFIGVAWVALCFFVLAGAAFLWRLAARREGGLALPVAAHMTADVSIIVAIALVALWE